MNKLLAQLLKSVYRILPLKKQLFSFLKLCWQPPEKIYRHLHFQGVIKVPLTDGNEFLIKNYGYQVENEIFWAGVTGGWEKESFKHWINLCKESEVIIDIGANTGIYALMAKSLNNKAKVYALEPVHRVFQKLEENIKLNNFDIIALEKAASDVNGQATIYDDQSEHIYSVTVNKNLLSPSTKVIETKIETIRLDTFIEQNNLKKIDLIKIDVETHEPQVLQGMGKYLKEFKPDLLIEILNEDIAKQVQEIVEDLGYLYFNIDEKNSLTIKTEKIQKSHYFNYLICKNETAVKLKLI